MDEDIFRAEVCNTQMAIKVEESPLKDLPLYSCHDVIHLLNERVELDLGHVRGGLSLYPSRVRTRINMSLKDGALPLWAGVSLGAKLLKGFFRLLQGWPHGVFDFR